MRKRSPIICFALIAVFYLYTGSVYMSSFYRLMGAISDTAVDIVTSGCFYLLQAAGIILFVLGNIRWHRVWSSKRLFAALIVTGALCMAVAQLSPDVPTIIAASCIFNLHIGIYSGFYLAMLSAHVPSERSGLVFGCAYALGSVGTYCLSLIDGGSFLASKRIVVVYILLAATAFALALVSEPLPPACKNVRETCRGAHLAHLCSVVAIITVISAIGSGLYYSLPIAENVNWNYIRAFYAIGLILSGLLIDANRFIGEVCAIASLAYPLIATAIIGEGATGSLALGMSYAFRGFVTIYYVIAFADLKKIDSSLAIIAPLGLAISRAVEALVTFVLFMVPVSQLTQLIVAAACFIPLLIVFVSLQNARYAGQPISDGKRMALFAEQFELTARESEVLGLLAQGLTDAEIAEIAFISKNTVRFHVSNILKKTGASSRVEAVRMLESL